MSVRKKNLPVRNIKVYPLNQDMTKTWFVRFYVAENMKHRLFINNKLSFSERVKETQRIVNDLKLNGFKDFKEKKENTANQHIQLLFDLVNAKVKLSKIAFVENLFCMTEPQNTIDLVTDAFLLCATLQDAEIVNIDSGHCFIMNLRQLTPLYKYYESK